MGKYIPSQNEKALWNLENDIMLHKLDKEKLPKLNKNWSSYYLTRFEDRLPSDLKNPTLNFYVPYCKLSETEKQQFIPEQKVSIRKIFEADELEKIKQKNQMYIYDGIHQVVRREIEDFREKLKEKRQKKPEKDNDPNIGRSTSFAFTLPIKIPGLSKRTSTDDMALLRLPKTEEEKYLETKYTAYDDLQLIKKKSSVEFGSQKKFKMNISSHIDTVSSPRMSKRPSLESLGSGIHIDKSNLLDLPDGLQVIEEDNDQASKKEIPSTDKKAPMNRITFSDKRPIEVTQDLTKLYEFCKEDDPDPFYELNSNHIPTFLEKVIGQEMDNYIKVEKPPTSETNDRNEGLKTITTINGDTKGMFLT